MEAAVDKLEVEQKSQGILSLEATLKKMQWDIEQEDKKLLKEQEKQEDNEYIKYKMSQRRQLAEIE